MSRKKAPPERLASNAIREGDEVVIDNPICPVCGLGSKSRVSVMKYYLLIGGAEIDDVLFPLKTSYQKQLMITGIHGHCERESNES